MKYYTEAYTGSREILIEDLLREKGIEYKIEHKDLDCCYAVIFFTNDERCLNLDKGFKEYIESTMTIDLMRIE